jgi:hypothetical protein
MDMGAEEFPQRRYSGCWRRGGCCGWRRGRCGGVLGLCGTELQLLPAGALLPAAERREPLAALPASVNRSRRRESAARRTEPRIGPTGGSGATRSWSARSNHPLAYRFEAGILTEASKGRRAIPARPSRAASCYTTASSAAALGHLGVVGVRRRAHPTLHATAPFLRVAGYAGATPTPRTGHAVLRSPFFRRIHLY